MKNIAVAGEIPIIFRIAKNPLKTYNYYINYNLSIDLNPGHPRVLNQHC